MKFLSLLCLTVGVTASAVRRDLATIKTVLAGIGSDLVDLDTATKAFNGNPQGLLDASNKLITDLKAGDATVQPLPGLSLQDALGLTGPAKDLQTKGDALLADIKAKKDALAAAGLCEVTFLQVSDINTASQALIKTVVSKVPADAQSIAQSLVAPLQKDLDEAQALFSPANCQNTGTTPTGTTTSAPTTAPPTSTKPPTSTPPPTSAPTTTTPTIPTTTPGGGNPTCPAASTITVTSTDTKDCTATPTCTSSAPVTVTTTTKACPTGSKLPW